MCLVNEEIYIFILIARILLLFILITRRILENIYSQDYRMDVWIGKKKKRFIHLFYLDVLKISQIF